MVDAVATELTKRFKKLEFDYIVGPEMKVVPLLSEVTKALGKKHYIVCRKSVKPYMVTPVVLKPLPYFPKHVRQLVLDGGDASLIKGKKVIILDDVVSTGVTMRMMEKLMGKVEAKVVLVAAVLRQGKQFPGTPEVFTLGEIPLLTDK